MEDEITNSNFGLTIQSWLRDSVVSQPHRRMSTYHDRPWSRSSRPWGIDKLQNDIEKYIRFNDFRNAIEVAKKMLHNGLLGKFHLSIRYFTN